MENWLSRQCYGCITILCGHTHTHLTPSCAKSNGSVVRNDLFCGSEDERLQPTSTSAVYPHLQSQARQNSHTHTASNTPEVSLGLDKQMCTRASGMRRPALRSLETLSPPKTCTRTQTNGRMGRRGRVVSRSAAAPTPGTPAHFQHEYRVNAAVALPRPGSQTEIRDSLKALMSGVLGGRWKEFCSLYRSGNVGPLTQQTGVGDKLIKGKTNQGFVNVTMKAPKLTPALFPHPHRLG